MILHINVKSVTMALLHLLYYLKQNKLCLWSYEVLKKSLEQKVFQSQYFDAFMAKLGK